MAHLEPRNARLELSAHNPYVAGSSPATATNALETNPSAALAHGNPSVRQIPLTQGKVALVDAEDYERVAQFKWFAVRHQDRVYAQRVVRINGLGWISDRHMKSGGSIGGRKGPHKGPLREVKEVLRFGEGMFDWDSVVFVCGHKGHRSIGANRGRCGECGKAARLAKERRACLSISATK